MYHPSILDVLVTSLFSDARCGKKKQAPEYCGFTLPNRSKRHYFGRWKQVLDQESFIRYVYDGKKKQSNAPITNDVINICNHRSAIHNTCCIDIL